MEQNRFSRQLIVLRAVIPGYSGHARLIHSDGSAMLEVRIQSPDPGAALSAALVEKGADGYVGGALGPLTTDERGQASGSFPLEKCGVAPEILAIVQTDDSDCKLAMSGFLNGARTVNWADVRTAACAATPTPAAAAAANELPETQEEDIFADFGANADHPFNASAAQAAGISPDAIWPEEIAALQPAFETQPAAETFPGTRYTFILVSAQDDFPEYYAGLWCQHGIPVRACYAVPAPDAYTQPQGLEDFCWRSGASGGFWVTYIDVQTGEPISDDT